MNYNQDILHGINLIPRRSRWKVRRSIRLAKELRIEVGAMTARLARHMTKVLGLLALVLMMGVSSCGEIEPPGNVVDDHPFFACGPAHEQPSLELHSLHWTADSNHLIFDFAKSGIWTVDAQGRQLRKIVDANPHEFYFMFGFHADLSPDGNQIIYSSCEFRTERGIQSYTERRDYNYEIAVIDLDGTGQQRLTANYHHDHYPVWSPDGSRIAFLANPKEVVDISMRFAELYTMAADGSDVLLVASTLRKVIRERYVTWHTPAELSLESMQQGEEPEDSEGAWFGSVLLWELYTCVHRFCSLDGFLAAPSLPVMLLLEPPDFLRFGL